MGKKLPVFFTRRGEKTVPIQLPDWDESVNVTIQVPTNREHDDMMEDHTEYGVDASVIVHSAAMLEDRLVKFLIDLPFEVPTNSEMTNLRKWSEISESEKRFALNCMDSDLRDVINDAIAGNEELTEEEAGN